MVDDHNERPAEGPLMVAPIFYAGRNGPKIERVDCIL